MKRRVAQARSRNSKLVESAYKIGYSTGAREMAIRSTAIMEDYMLAEYVGDLFGFIGLAVHLRRSGVA